MVPTNAYNQYKENSIYTANPEDLTLMLYNGLIKFIMQGTHAIDEGRMDKANESFIKAQDILHEFQSTLDRKYPISEQLMSIYDYMYRRLVEANIKKDRAIAEEVLGFARELRDVWGQAMKIARQPKAQVQQIAR